MEEAREQLKEIMGDLGMIRSRLLEVSARLPMASESWRPLGAQENLDVAKELRAAIDCIVEDSVGPAIADLWGAAEPAGNRPASGDEEAWRF